MNKYEIAVKKTLTPEITLISVYAPLIAKKAKAGQFIILRVDGEGERIPLTISNADPEKGLVTIVFQKIGATTLALDLLNEGDCLHDFVGPLGVATEVENLGRVAVLGGGLGGLIAMVFKRHKNRHLDFIMVFTMTSILHMLAAFLLIGKFAFIM